MITNDASPSCLFTIDIPSTCISHLDFVYRNEQLDLFLIELKAKSTILSAQVSGKFSLDSILPQEECCQL